VEDLVAKAGRKTTFKTEALVLVGLMLGLFLGPGCALFRSHPEATGPENAGFHRTASTSSNPVPLPVEIVTDISMIASGYGTQQDGVWKPVYPEAEKLPPASAVSPSEASVQRAPADPPPAVVPDSEKVSAAEEVKDQEKDQKPIAKEPTVAIRSKRRTASSGKTEDYTVKNGDTLMKISFAKYGNIYRWREIYESNQARISNFNSLVAGTVLTIQGVEYVVITKNGVPYLIRRGDTLGKISKSVYGVSEKWRAIWKNNPELIQNPNKIYAGFTLYYVPAPGSTKVMPVRQVSSDSKVDLAKAPAAPAPAVESAPPTNGASTQTTVSQPMPASQPNPSAAGPEESSWVPTER
jgi:hypothetical protein